MSNREPVTSGARGFIIGALVLYAALLSVTAIWSSQSKTFWDPFTWKPDTSNWVLQIGGHLSALAVREVALFWPLAFLCGASASRPNRLRRWLDIALALVFGFAGSLTLALMLKSVMAGLPLHAPSIVVIVFFAMICLHGSWAGASWSRSYSIGGWLFCQLVSIVVFVASLMFSFAWFGLEADPLAVASTPVAGPDRVRLVKMIREHDPRRLEPGEQGQLTLTELDCNQLLTWGLTVLPGEHQAAVAIDDDKVSLSLTSKLPKIPIFNDVLNVRVAGIPVSHEGELGVSPRTLRIGRINLPARLLRFSGPMMIDKDWHNDTTRPIFSALQQVTVEDEKLTMVYGRLDLPDGFVRDALVGIGAVDDLAPTMRAHTLSLLRLASENERLTFGQCMETAFATARQRSSDGDPAKENRGAILALGYLLGHPVIKKFVGSEVPEIPAESNRKFRAVTLRDRHDWTRHYTVSAALEVLSNKFTSRAVGVLKEELDADGGSGFSFGDLLADRAGTKLSISATRSAEAAKAMQTRLTGGFVEDDFMPKGADLPEGLQQAEFKKQFGDVGDARYESMLTNIDRRISNCAAYR